MARQVKIAAAQMGPINEGTGRDEVVDRMLVLLEQAIIEQVDLIAYPEMALTTYFPKHIRNDYDQFFENEVPPKALEPMLRRAREKGVAVHVGFCEKTGGHHFNTALLTDETGTLLGTYRKIHLPGRPSPDGFAQVYEVRYFETGDTGYRVFSTRKARVGIAICQDRRYPEPYRCLGLLGADIVLIGYNTPLSPLALDQNELVLRAGAYENSMFVVGIAKAGVEDGLELIGGSCIVGPLGQVLARAATTGDELIAARIDLDWMTPARKRWDFFSRRHPQYYGQITEPVGEGVMTARALDLVVAGGRVVTSVEVLDTAVGIRDGRIVALAPVEDLPPAERTIDATGKIVFPGAIDCHVHLGPEYDDWRGGPLAAAQAGLGTILSFVLADEANHETLPTAIHRLREEISAQSILDFGFHFILGNQPWILEGIPEAIGLGVTSFKLFMTYKKRKTRMCSDEMIAGAMQLIATHGGLCQLHCENGDVIAWLEDRALAEGRVKPTDFPATCPDWTEEEAINRAILIGRMTNCPVYVVHLSTRLGLERIKQAQALGQRVYTETCPQYLLLTEDAMQQWGPLAKIGPPLRPAAGGDREALWAGLAQGPIAAVASDHSPRPKAMKEAGWKNIFQDENGNVIPFGSPGLETLVPLVYSEGVVKRGLPLTWMARVLGENPARMFGLHPRKGSIRVGADADLLIWDPTAKGEIHVADHRGIAGWTLYEDWKTTGRPWMTLLRGQPLLENGQLRQKPGYGQFLHRGSPLPPITSAAY